MSLVAYESSDGSDTDEEVSSVVPQGTSIRGLLSSLPAPKSSLEAPGNASPRKEAASNVPPRTAISSDTQDSTPSTGLFASLPKPKKRTEPVKITIPDIDRADSDSDGEEPAKKKLQPQAQGSHLSSLLPQPRNLTLKESNRPLLPHMLTKRPNSQPSQPRELSRSPSGALASPSAIKAAAKSAALHVARQIASEEPEEEEVAPENYFSLNEPPLPRIDPEPEGRAPFPPQVGDVSSTCPSDAPLDFGSHHPSAEQAVWDTQRTLSNQAGLETGPQGYYNEPYYQDPEPGSAEAEGPASSAMFDDEAFMRLQGKRNRGKEEVKFLEIKGDDQLSGSQQWMTKSITEEKQERRSYSKKKGDQPTGQQRRKHQITYLIHQAKERELELKNSWSDNKLSRRQTQAKYGF